MIGPIASNDRTALSAFYERAVFWLLIPAILTLMRLLSVPDREDLTGAIVVFNFLMVWGTWLLFHLCTIAVTKYLAPRIWKTNGQNDLVRGYLVLAMGAAIGTLILFPTRPARGELFCMVSQQMQGACGILPPSEGWLDAAGILLRLSMLSEIYWLLGNYIVATLFDTSRYGFHISRHRKATGSENATVDGDTSPLLARLPLELGDDIVSLSANQHYLNVRTRKGNAMVLYRLSDAVKELGDRGVQIHRSYWVAFDAIQSIEREASTMQVFLDNGEKFPVSRGNRHIFRSSKFSRMQLS